MILPISSAVPFASAAAAESAVGAHAEEIVLRLLYQLIAVLLATRIVVFLVRRVGQTPVSGEILAGLLLGPSCLGALAPESMERLFHSSTSTIFVGIAQIGLVLLMFQIGLEFEFQASLAARKRSVVAISAMGLLMPFILGFATAPFFYMRLAPPRPPELGFQLFFATAMSITAIPILGRIFMELRLSHTRTAALTIGSAAIDDVVGWLLLGVVSLVVRAEFAWSWLGTRLALLGLYLAFVMIVARPLLKRLIAVTWRGEGRLPSGTVASLLVALFISAAVTSNLGVFAIIGGFVVGVALHDDRKLVGAWRETVSPLVNTLFLPVFFAYTGLRTDIGALRDFRELGLCLLVCLVAFAGKLGGAYLGARLAGEGRRTGLAIAVCMNTRALMELVALNVGLDLGAIPPSMFTKLVLMAIASTYIATPLIRRLMRGQELAAPESQLAAA